MICFYDEDKRVPLGVAEIRKEDGLVWLMFVMTAKNSPRGTGTIMLKKIVKNCRNIHIRTSYENLAMFFCAIKSGFKLIGTDNYGFILRR